MAIGSPSSASCEIVRCAPSAVVDWISGNVERRAVVAREAHIVVPGGSTPLPILSELGRAVQRGLNVSFSLTDERCVPVNSKNRNETPLIRSVGSAKVFRLLDKAGKLVTESVPAPTVSLIGVGEDGHIASIFPGSRALPEAELGLRNNLIVVSDAPDGMTRVSRTYSGLVGSAATGVVISGPLKRKLMLSVLSGAFQTLPVARLLEKAANLIIFDLI